MGLIGGVFAFAPKAEAVNPNQDFQTLAQPKRVLETRSGFPGYVNGTTKPAGGSVTKVRVAGGDTTVPGSAVAVSLNVTGVESVGNDGYLTVWDCTDDVAGGGGTEPDPPFTSNVNLTSNDIRPNAVIVEVGSGADDDHICIYTRNTTHLLVDVNGYFPAEAFSSNHLNLDANGATAGDGPVRILDTRPASLVGYDAGKPVAGQVLKIPALDPGRPQILNVTGVDATAPGWLTVWDCEDEITTDNAAGLTEPDQPNTSNHYLHPGVIAANLVITESDGNPTYNDQVCIFTSAGAHIVVDRIGTFPTGSDFETVDPVRVLETRPAPFPTTPEATKFPGGTSVSRLLTSFLPEDVTAVALNVTATDSASGYVTVYPCVSSSDPATPPNASNLNLVAGQTRPNLVITGISNTDRICVFTQSATHLVIDMVGYFTAEHPAPPTTSTSTSTSTSSTTSTTAGT